MLSKVAVSSGYAELIGRYRLPLFVTQTFAQRSHPERVLKAHRYALTVLNDELHGRNWRRKGIVGCQSVLGIERHISGFPHSHALIGDPQMDLGNNSLSALRRVIKLTFDQEFGFSRVEVPRVQADVDAYISKYVCKDGEIYFSDDLEALRGQLFLGEGTGGV